MSDCLGNIPELNLCFSQGSDQRVLLVFTPESGTDPPVDFTDARAAAHMRTTIDASSFFPLSVVIDDGVLENNEIALELTSEAMEALDARNYVGDLKVIFANGKPWTPFRISLTLIRNSTRGTDFL